MQHKKHLKTKKKRNATNSVPKSYTSLRHKSL